MTSREHSDEESRDLPASGTPRLDPAELRQRAEEQVRAVELRDPATLSSEETRQTLHELQVHQIELEMQNEELRRAQAELEAARARYFDLYDMAPVGYCTVSETGQILEANLTAATLLGVARRALVQQALTRFIVPEDQDIYYRRRKRLFETGEPQSFELRLVKPEGAPFWARLEANASRDDNTGVSVCRVAISDINPLKQAEQEIAAREARFRILAESTFTAIFLYRQKFLYANSAAERLSGYTLEELLQMDFWELVHPDHRELVRARGMARLRGEPLPSRYEFKMVTKSGETRWVDFTGGVVQFEGQTAGLGTAYDITERKQAEEALAASVREWHTTFDAINDAIFLTDLDGRILKCNQALVQLAGRPFEEIIGQSCFPILHGTSEPIAGCPFQRMRQSLQRENLELSMGERWYDVVVDPLFDASGNLAGSVHTIIDITERRAIEERFRASEELYRTLVESLEDGITVTDIDRRYRLANTEALRRWGYTSLEEVLGKTPSDLFAPEVSGQLEAEMAQVVETGILLSEERPSTSLIGPKWVERRRAPVRDQAGNVISVVTISRDITDRKRAEEALRESEELYRTLVESMDDSIVVRDREGRYRFVNSESARRIGLPAEEIVGKTIRQLNDAKIATEIEQEDAIVMSTGQPLERDRHGYNPTAPEWMTMRKTPLRNAAGQVVGLVAVTRDITGRKQGEEQRRQHAVRNSLLAEISRAIAEGGLEYQAVLRTTAQRVAETLGDACIIRLLSEDQQWLDSVAFHHIDPEALSYLQEIAVPRQSMQEGLSGQVAQSRVPILFPTISKEELIPLVAPSFREHIERGNINSLLVVPILAHGQTLGVLRASRDTAGRPYTEDDRDFLMDIAGRAGMAISNARLFEAGQHELAERRRAEAELETTLERLQVAVEGTALALARVTEVRDPYTAGHQARVSKLACAIAMALGLTEVEMRGVEFAATIHDIGKIQVPADILSKPGQLHNMEMMLIRQHPETGFGMLKDISFPWPISDIILQHHERMDGSGYPQGLKGEDICLAARIIAVADVVEAMASYRPYRPARGLEAALAEIRQNRGTLYDDKVAGVCLDLFASGQFNFDQTQNTAVQS